MSRSLYEISETLHLSAFVAGCSILQSSQVNAIGELTHETHR
jgi:hypothetical protein